MKKLVKTILLNETMVEMISSLYITILKLKHTPIMDLCHVFKKRKRVSVLPSTCSTVHLCNFKYLQGLRCQYAQSEPVCMTCRLTTSVDKSVYTEAGQNGHTQRRGEKLVLTEGQGAVNQIKFR